ncbi:unnamed protein product [Durusdinium trenchii]|uniref:Uncharacterized protein n=1 Tax=Durusdinium trenchii TaxID=1381693 RepID=A0ABP0PGK9_9DINO
MGIALRSPVALESPLDTSNDFSLGPAFQAHAAAQLSRFVDSEVSFSARELCSVDLSIQSPHDERLDWWEHIRRCRRRAQARPVPSLSVAALLLPPSIRYKARLDSSISKVKAVLRRRQTSPKQLFALQAGQRCLHMSVIDLARALQQFGFLDQAEAGRLALAAARFESQSLTSDANLFVSLDNFVRLMGSVPGSLVEERDDQHDTSSVMASPSAQMAETQLNLEAGRWAIKIVPHDRMVEVWSSRKVPGSEARPFSIWRPDLKTGAAAGGNTFQQGLRSLVGAGTGRLFLLGDIGKRGLDAPAQCLVAKVKMSRFLPKGAGLGLGLEAWMSRFLPRPVAFRLLWHDRRGATADAFGGPQAGSASSPSGEGLYVWRPVPPSDLFVAPGAVCTADSSEPRGVEIRCVPRAWLVRGDSLGPALWTNDRHEVKVQEGLGGVIACPTENLSHLPCWTFISHQFFAGT